MATLRGSALPAVDLRACLGLVTARAELDELLGLLRAREQDHRNWLAELEASVRERRPFSLQTDPRQCRFGQWYYSFRTDDPVLRGEIERLERPHASIHAVGREVEALKAEGRWEKAVEVMEAARHGLLAELVRLFEALRHTIEERHREIGVTVVLDGRRMVLIVDSAHEVADLEMIADADDPVVTGGLRAGMVQRLALTVGGDKRTVMLLDLDRVAAALRQSVSPTC